METIRFAEKRRTSKWPAIIVTCFLILGGCFVAYLINFEDNPRMLGFSGEVAMNESNGLEEVGLSDAEKLEQLMNLNYEIKDVSTTDQSTPNISFTCSIQSLRQFIMSSTKGKSISSFNCDSLLLMLSRFML